MFDYFSGNMDYKVLIAMLVDFIGHTFLELKGSAIKLT